MGRLFVAPYKPGSASAKALAQSLGVKRVDGSKIFRSTDLIINWGKSVLSPRGNPRIINRPSAVAQASNKITAFQRFNAAGVPTVDWTTDSMVARQWLRDGHVVFGRELISAHSGRGIVIMTEGNGHWKTCPLYTKGIMKAHEYRVHVSNGEVIDIQKKRRRSESSSTSDYIKNLSNGWVFCRDNVNAPFKVYQESIRAVKALGLDFGAVDIAWKESENRVAILEVNTACGLEGQTLTNYINSFRILSPPENFLVRGG